MGGAEIPAIAELTHPDSDEAAPEEESSPSNGSPCASLQPAVEAAESEGITNRGKGILEALERCPLGCFLRAEHEGDAGKGREQQPATHSGHPGIEGRGTAERLRMATEPRHHEQDLIQVA